MLMNQRLETRLRPLLVLGEREDRRVHDHALAVDDELLGHLVRLVVLLRGGRVRVVRGYESGLGRLNNLFVR